MKFLFAVLVAILSVAAAAPLSEDAYEILFIRFASRYNKSYQNNDMLKRYNIFKSNLDMIISHNLKGESYELGMNQFGDLTTEEFGVLTTGITGFKDLKTQATEASFPTDAINADSINWNDKGVVNPIKNQGSCGSCWAFSAVSALESAYALQSGKLLDLSEQQLVDCSGSTGNHGCRGGLMDKAYTYIKNNGGVCETKDYPYTARDETCKKTCSPAVNVSGYKWVSNERDLLTALNQLPISIAVAASNSEFQFYKSGVVDKGCGGALNHAVNAVGYGTEDGKDYWLVRNSWGASWGDKGHIKIIRDKNMCLINSYLIYPTL